MINLKFLKIWAVFENCPDDLLRQWWRRVKNQMTEARVDFERKKLKLPCIVSNGELKWSVMEDLGAPSWFQLVLQIPQNWRLVEGGKVKVPVEKNGKRYFIFRNGFLVRFLDGSRLVVDYLGVIQREGKYFFFSHEKWNIRVPARNRGELINFLKTRVPEDLVNAAVQIFQPQPIINKKWVEGLEKVKLEKVKEKVKEEVKEEENTDIDVEVEMKVKNEKKRKRKYYNERKEKQRKPLPVRSWDDVPDIPIGTPVEVLLKYYQ